MKILEKLSDFFNFATIQGATRFCVHGKEFLTPDESVKKILKSEEIFARRNLFFGGWNLTIRSFVDLPLNHGPETEVIGKSLTLLQVFKFMADHEKPATVVYSNTNSTPAPFTTFSEAPTDKRNYWRNIETRSKIG